MRLYLEGHGGVDYQRARSNYDWPDHVTRAHVTGALIASLQPTSLLDPACGDGSIVEFADTIFAIADIRLADVSPGNAAEYGVECADVFDTVAGSSPADVLVLTEILEHLVDPDSLLRLAYEKGHRWLVASSPEMRPGQKDDNLEHLWQFDGEGYVEMLRTAGWQPHTKVFLGLAHSSYDFGIWACTR